MISQVDTLETINEGLPESSSLFLELLNLEEKDYGSKKELAIRTKVIDLLSKKPLTITQILGFFPLYKDNKDIAISATSGSSSALKLFSNQIKQDPDVILNSSCEGSFACAKGLDLVDLFDFLCDNFDRPEEQVKQAKARVLIRKAISSKSSSFHNESLTILNDRMKDMEFVNTDIFKDFIGDTLEFFDEASLSREDIQSKTLKAVLAEEKQRRSLLKIKLKTKASSKNSRKLLSS